MTNITVQKAVIGSPEWQKAIDIYLSSFPIDERRPLEQMERLVRTDARFHFYIAEAGGQTAAFITIWDLGEFIYCEHLAVDSKIRGGGIGSQLIEWVCCNMPKPCILEIEPTDEEGVPDEEMSIRAARLKFYNRLGFKECPLPYMQPPYTDGQNSIPLTLMERGGHLLPDRFPEVRDTIHTIVYNK